MCLRIDVIRGMASLKPTGGRALCASNVDFDCRPTTIVIPGTRVEALPPGDLFPLRVRVQKADELKYDTDLLIDQIRAIANARFMFRYCTVHSNLLKRTEEALRLLTGR